MNLLYTRFEGGEFIPIQYKGSVEDLLSELEANRIPEDPYSMRPGPRSVIQGVQVFSVAFPGNHIWDAYMRENESVPLREMWRVSFEELYKELSNRTVPT